MVIVAPVAIVDTIYITIAFKFVIRVHVAVVNITIMANIKIRYNDQCTCS